MQRSVTPEWVLNECSKLYLEKRLLEDELVATKAELAALKSAPAPVAEKPTQCQDETLHPGEA